MVSALIAQQAVYIPFHPTSTILSALVARFFIKVKNFLCLCAGSANVKIVRVDYYNDLALCLDVVDSIACAASLICVHIINSQNNICVICKRAVTNIIT